MQSRSWVFPPLALLAVLLVWGEAGAQCDPGDILIGEDEKYWYCAKPEQLHVAAEVLDKISGRLIGPEWRYRKAVIDTAGALAREGRLYRYGGKIRVTSSGQETWICVASECAGTPASIDCSGFAEYSARAACFVTGFYRAAGVALRGVVGNAQQQSDFFRSRSAFIRPSGAPAPGDFIFFENTARGRKGITHVGIFLGRTADNVIFMIHASSHAGRVIFQRLKPGDDLSDKLAGFGDVSIALPR